VKRPAKSRQRQPLPPISEQMKAWSAALAEEVSSWPQAKPRSFFGFTALYRGATMFAVLPRTRSMETANAVAFRLDAPTAKLRSILEKDQRITAFDKDKARWFALELSSDADLHDALEWLGKAYNAAASRKKSR
jgi:hypothetical protein